MKRSAKFIHCGQALNILGLGGFPKASSRTLQLKYWEPLSTLRKAITAFAIATALRGSSSSCTELNVTDTNPSASRGATAESVNDANAVYSSRRTAVRTTNANAGHSSRRARAVEKISDSTAPQEKQSVVNKSAPVEDKVRNRSPRPATTEDRWVIGVKTPESAGPPPSASAVSMRIGDSVRVDKKIAHQSQPSAKRSPHRSESQSSSSPSSSTGAKQDSSVATRKNPADEQTPTLARKEPTLAKRSNVPSTTSEEDLAPRTFPEPLVSSNVVEIAKSPNPARASASKGFAKLSDVDDGNSVGLNDPLPSSKLGHQLVDNELGSYIQFGMRRKVAKLQAHNFPAATRSPDLTSRIENVGSSRTELVETTTTTTSLRQFVCSIDGRLVRRNTVRVSEHRSLDRQTIHILYGLAQLGSATIPILAKPVIARQSSASESALPAEQEHLQSSTPSELDRMKLRHDKQTSNSGQGSPAVLNANSGIRGVTGFASYGHETKDHLPAKFSQLVSPPSPASTSKTAIPSLPGNVDVPSAKVPSLEIDSWRPVGQVSIQTAAPVGEFLEDRAAERFARDGAIHSYTYGISQPAISAAHFFGTIPFLPYSMVAEKQHEPTYTLGH